MNWTEPSPCLLRLDRPSEAYWLLNLGAVALVSASAEGCPGIMPASWHCEISIDPCRVVVGLDPARFTRGLIEHSGRFGLSFVSEGTLDAAHFLGSVSAHDDPEKLEHAGGQYFRFPGSGVPFLAGSPLYALCRTIDEPEMRRRYGLFVAEVESLWVDGRAVDEKRLWRFDRAPGTLRPAHAMTDGNYFLTGRAVRAAL